MFWFVSKKELKKLWERETSKIRNSFNRVDEKTESQGKSINQLRKDIILNNSKIARLEGAFAVLMSKSQSQSQRSLRRSQGAIETKIINKVRRSKKAVIMAQIQDLVPSHSVIEIFEILVKDKGLCSKASFYRYIQSLRSQNLLKLRQK